MITTGVNVNQNFNIFGASSVQCCISTISQPVCKGEI